MQYGVIPPGEELKELVSHFWYGTWDCKSQAPNTVYYVIANTVTDIIFAFDGTERHSRLLFSSVQGHTYTPARLPVSGFYHLLGVSIHSYALPYLFNIPSYDLNKEFIPLDTFLGARGVFLNEQIALAGNVDQRIKIISNFFVSLLKPWKIKDRLMISAVSELRSLYGSGKIMDLAGDCSLSPKQFNRRFRDFSGFTPKMYARIVRFEEAINRHASLSTLTDLACQTGYYDQAHFNHEFKTFTGFNPRDFWKLNDDN